MSKRKDVEEGFYQRCAELLDVATEYADRNPSEKMSHLSGTLYRPTTKATRWGGREPGNGRFPGRGTIRMYSPELIHVSLTNPRGVNRTFGSDDEVFAFLTEIMSHV